MKMSWITSGSLRILMNYPIAIDDNLIEGYNCTK